MNGKRFWQFGGFLVCVAILALGWFVVISPGFKTVDDNNEQRAAVVAKNGQIQADIANLSKVDVSALEDHLRARIAQIPPGLVEEDVYQELKTFGAEAGVNVTDISITQPGAFATNQRSAAGTDPSAPVAPGSPIAVPGLPISPADLGQANQAGMYDSPVSITIEGSFAGARRFMAILTKQSARTFLVTGASLNAAGGSMNLKAIIWFKPRAIDLLADLHLPGPGLPPPPAAPAPPSPAATPSAIPSPAPSGTPSASPSPTPRG